MFATQLGTTDQLRLFDVIFSPSNLASLSNLIENKWLTTFSDER